jgi:hypothetical protein
MTCAGFSQDSTLMTVGFAESYIRLWNLKGEKLRGMRSDFQVTGVKDGAYRGRVTKSLFILPNFVFRVFTISYFSFVP